MSAPVDRMWVRSLLLLEWDKVRRDRAVFFAIAGLVLMTAAFAAMYSWVARSIVDDGGSIVGGEALSFVIVKGSIAPTIAGVLGAWIGGGDYRQRTWALTLVHLPRRGRALAAKQVIVAMLSVAIAAIAVVVSGTIAAFMVGSAHVLGDPAALVRTGVAHVAVAICWGSIGCSLGILLRSSLRAVLVFSFIAIVLEPTLNLARMTGNTVMVESSRWLLSALSTATQMLPASSAAPTLFAETPASTSPEAAMCILGAYVAAAGVGAWFAFRRQAL